MICWGGLGSRPERHGGFLGWARRNRRIAPRDLESALGRDTLQTLSEQASAYDEVLSNIESLPDTVDQLTPEGRPPTTKKRRAG